MARSKSTDQAKGPTPHQSADFILPKGSEGFQEAGGEAAPSPVTARPVENPDWDALLIETQVEFRKTLDYLGK